MTSQGHLSSKYFAFLKKINAVDPECQKVPDLFFPEDLPNPETRSAAIKVAKALCRECELMSECRTYALETNQRFGIWGGTLPSER